MEGWAPVSKTGWMAFTPATPVASYFADLAARDPAQAVTLAAASQNIQGGRGSEAFNLRTPEHIVLAGKLGLGHFDQNQIMHRVIRL